MTGWLLPLVFLSLNTWVNAATPPSTLITNTATASYSLQGTATQRSASVDIQTVDRTPSTINFYSISSTGTPVTLPPASFSNIPANAPGFLSNVNLSAITQVTLSNGNNTSLPTSLPIELATQFQVNDPIVIEVRDLDKNLDSSVIETIFVTISVPETGDTEIIQLVETSPSSGVFRGAIQTTDANTLSFNGLISVEKDARINVNYKDSVDSTDLSATAALIEPTGKISLSKHSSTSSVSVGDTLSYTLKFNSNNFANGLNNLEIRDLLPPGFRYVNNSATLNSNSIATNKIVVNGRSLRFIIGSMPKLLTWEISYRVSVGTGSPRLHATNTAQAFATGEQSFVAKAVVEIKDELLRNTIILTGRITKGCENETEIINRARITIETGQSTYTDSKGFWHLDGVTSGTHLVTLDTESLPDGLIPLRCNNSTQFAGKADSQFVDVKGGGIWRADFHVQDHPDIKSKGIRTKHQKALKNSSKDDEDTTFNPLNIYNDDYARKAKEGFEILWPPKRYVPPISSISIAIKHAPKHKVVVTLNNKKISALNYHGSSTNKAKTLRISRWRGIDIDTRNRENTLHVVVKNSSGKTIKEQSRLIHFSGEPSSAEYLPDQSELLADGSSTPNIAVLIRDKEGFPMRKNTHVYFTVENGQYQIEDGNTESDKESIDINAEYSKGEHKAIIDKKGIAHIRLKPTTQTGEIRINIKLYENKKEKLRAWLKPHLRKKWIMVGLAEGTVGYNKLSGNIQTLTDLEKKERLYRKGRVAFFAKGKVKGKYLLTLAYDSAKRRTDVGEHLNGEFDPDAFYTIYGDNAINQHEAKSSSKLFVKLEREQFYLLFGDYRTNMTVTELSRYERTLHGIHSEYKGRNYRINTSFSETSNKHQHDEISGDGTSGEYHLKQPVIPNSEVVILETRNRFHPEVIISQRLLALHADYEIDYDSQSLFFKFPIASRDLNLNPNFIVVDYESETNAKKSIAASGRVAYLTNDGKTEIGVSVIHENDTSGISGDLIGTDIAYQYDEVTTLKAEVAHSRGSSSGNAWLLEAHQKSSQLTGRAYIRQQDASFGLEQQNISERGTRKFGVDGRYNLNTRTYLQGDIYRQENLDNNNSRDQLSLEFGKETTHSSYGVGIRHTNEFTNGISRKGTLLTLGGSVSPKTGRLTLRSHLEKNIGGRGANEAYPDRLIVGADFGLTDGIALFLEREITRSDDVDTTTDRAGLSSKLWDGASLKSSINRENQYGGDRTFATLGLAQHLSLTDKLSVDLSVDRAETIKNAQIEAVDSNQPAINGSLRDDFTAFSVGLGWREDTWSWTTRIEHRDGDREDKVNFRYGLLHQLGNDRDISARINFTRSELDTGLQTEKATISIGSAWHPQNNDYTLLQRLDFIREETLNNTLNTSNYKGSRKIIHNIHVNKKAGEKTQISLHHGLKHTLEDEFNQKFSSTVDTAQIQIRRNISEKMDVGLHAGYLHDWDNDNWQYNVGGSLGFTPAENMWMSAGYNLEGFTDDDFDESEYTAKGPFLQFRYRADKDQLRKITRSRKQKKSDGK